MKNKNMNCQEIKSLSVAYNQLDVDDKRRDEIDSHLCECESCNSFYIFNKHVFEQIEQEKQTEINLDFFAAVKNTINNTNQEKSNSKILHYLKVSTAAAAIFIAIIGGNYIGNYSAQTLNDGFTEATSDEIIDFDMADNDFDLFKDF